MHTANTRNNSVYFLILKFHYKVADLMIKPVILIWAYPLGGAGSLLNIEN